MKLMPKSAGWELFDRRRNRLSKERASQLVFVHCNSRLLRQFKAYNYAENYIKVDDESEDGNEEENDDNNGNT